MDSRLCAYKKRKKKLKHIYTKNGKKNGCRQTKKDDSQEKLITVKIQTKHTAVKEK